MRAQVHVALQLSATSVAQGTVSAISASVTNAGAPATVGVVDFYDGGRLVGSVQLVGVSSPWGAVGSAVFRKIFAPGSHSLKATLRGTLSIPAASSAATVLTVSGAPVTDIGLQYAGTTDLADHGGWDFVSNFTLADINLDGLPDLLGLQFDEGQVAAVLGNPSAPGTFITPPSFFQGKGEAGARVLTADLNGDGLLDMVVLFVDTNQISVFLATAPGVFGPPTFLFSTSGAQYPQAVVADFNGDGLPDIVVIGDMAGSPDVLNTWLNNPSRPGTFLPVQSTTLSAASSPGWMETADLNGDGLPDIVVSAANFSSSALTVLLNDPTSPGLRWNAVNYNLGVATWHTALADLNGDGLPDFIAGTFGGSVLVALNDAGHPGSLLSPRTFPAPANMQTTYIAGVAAGDIHGDGLIDVAAADDANHFVVFRGDGTGNLVAGTPISGAPTPLSSSDPMFAWESSGIAVADLDGDGLGDVVLTEERQNTAQVYRHAAVAGALIQTATDLSIPPQFYAVYRQGQPIPITATETSSSGTMSGTVEFFDTGGGTQFTSIGTAPILAGTALFTVQHAALGSHDYEAVFHGDSTFAASESAIFPVTVIVGPTASVVLTGAPNPAAVSQSVSFRATVTAGSGGGGTPTGSVLFLDGTTPLASSPIVSGVASINISTLTAGTHSVTAIYSGDASFPGSTSNTLLEVIQGPVTTVLTVTPTLATVGTAIQFQANVAATSAGSPVPTGSVVFVSGTTVLGTGNLNAAGSASLTISTLPLGTYSVTAQYSGDAIFPAGSSNTVQLNIIAASTSTALSIAPNPAYAGQLVSIVATVSSQPTSSQGINGSVTFFDGSVPLGTQSSTSSGVFTLTTTNLAIGTHPITATFTASASGLIGSASPVVNEVVLASAFTLSLSPTNITLRSGASGTVMVQLLSVGNFAGPLHLTVGSLPTYSTATLQPSIVTLTPSGSAFSTLTLNTLLKASNTPPSAPGPTRSTGVLAALILMIAPCLAWRRRTSQRLLTLALLVATLSTLAGCNTAWYTTNAVAAGSYQLPVTATDFAQHSQTAVLNVTITP